MEIGTNDGEGADGMTAAPARSVAARHLSRPLAAILSSAGLSVEDVDDAITEQIARGLPPLLRPGHPQNCKLADATGFNIVSLARRYHRLLVEIEQKPQQGIWWIYREHNRTNADFMCSGVVPDTVAAALGGRPLSVLADPPFEIGTAVIKTASVLESNSMSVAVTPLWIDL